MTTVHVLTAGHNDLSNLKSLLKSLAAQSLRSSTITVVDDGSTDNTSEYLSTHYPHVKLIRGDGNLWWTGALNLGLSTILPQAGNNDYVLTLNNDCTVGPHYLRHLLTQASPNRVVGSKIVDRATGKLWDLGETIDWSRGKITARRSNTDPLDTLTTKGTLYPVNLFKKIGLLSSHLTHYVSDYELAVRAKRRGYQLAICESAVVKNDTDNTGIGDHIPASITFKDTLKLMFGRRSKLNLVDQFWFITLACPLIYRPINYVRLILKAIYLLVIPFPPLHKLLSRAYNHSL